MVIPLVAMLGTRLTNNRLGIHETIVIIGSYAVHNNY